MHPQQPSSGYRTPPPPPHMVPNDPHGWSAPPPQHHPASFPPPLSEQQHLHHRAPHHPHPYHISQPSSSNISHSRTPSRSHSRTHSLTQPQFAPQHAIQSPPQPRHASPSAPVPRYQQDLYPERVDPVRFPAPVPAPQHPTQRVSMVEDEEENDGEIIQGSIPVRPSAAEEEQTDSSKCPDCGKTYKHATSLLKHRWEHSMYWKPATKFLLSKHQQVQLMEAAAILLSMDEAHENDKDSIVDMFIKQRGQLASGTSTASVSPSTSTKSLSVSPPPMAERALAMKQEPIVGRGAVMSPPPASFHGRAGTMTRHSVTSTTSIASSLSSTPPSLAPDDESVAEVEEEVMMTGPPSSFRQHQQQHHPGQQQQPPSQMMMARGMEMGQKHPEPHYYQHESRFGPAPFHHHQQHHLPPQQLAQPYPPYYHD
ncbi:hypothetical protein BGX27_000887 [Mortierella sp. AM989]|nr:hypothetical protein BGX27_000887 [Mortierella sp. AM989]